MTVRKMLISLVGGILLMSPVFNNMAALAADPAAPQKEPELRVDIPVSLKKANVVFDIGRVTFSKDLPVALRFMDIMVNRFKEQGTEGQIIGSFYGDAAYLVLNDQAYNKHRNVTTGNPYKGLITALQAQGVQMEECAMSMKLQKIRNDDLLPGVKVNSGANLRMVQLMQQGFLRLQP
ncbi:MAG: DsrE family protein [Deltaproteobacteria bacterium]|nr:DsrE family protein [Deltaproteobacteria bacterium]